MIWNYAYTPTIWPSVGTTIFLLILAAYSWHRRSVPGALPLAISCLLAVLIAVGEFMTHLSANDGLKLFWGKFEDVWILPSTTAVTCFILEYAWPGRWLTRRNLILLSIVPLLGGLYRLTGEFFGLIPDVQRGGTLLNAFGRVGGVLFTYSLALALINLIVFGWLFARSPQHRWPVLIMVAGQIVTRVLLVQSSPEQDAWLFYVPEYIFAYLSYAIALFGFHIFDPIPLARQTALNQLHAGMLVLDHQGRIVSLNLSAARIFGLSSHQAKGQLVTDLLPAYQDAQTAVDHDSELEFSLGNGSNLRHYSLAISPLNDFRGLEVGQLLMLRDITEQKQAQVKILEQQRVLAAQHERERMARELHDSLGQVLSFTSFGIETAVKLSGDGKVEEATAQLARLGPVVRDAHADLREHILNLHSTLSAQQPFFTAVEQYLDRFTASYDLQTHLSVGQELEQRSFSPDTQMQIFRILQEALSNARKHGRAHQIQVIFSVIEGQIRMCIQDDGCGFVLNQVTQEGKSHFGLHFMRERASDMGGSLQVQSTPGAGTLVELNIPIMEG